MVETQNFKYRTDDDNGEQMLKKKPAVHIADVSGSALFQRRLHGYYAFDSR